jgi:hypothetical protein
VNGEQNLRLIREIEANREFMLAVYRQNPALLEKAEPRVRDLFAPADVGGKETGSPPAASLHGS